MAGKCLLVYDVFDMEKFCNTALLLYFVEIVRFY